MVKSNINKFQLQSPFQRFYTKLCACSHKKDIKHIDQNIHSVALVMPQWWDLRMVGVKNLSEGICEGALSTAHSNVFRIILQTVVA